LAKELGVAVADASTALAAIGLEATSISCNSLHSALVENASKILGVALPRKPDMACLDQQCSETLSVSDVKLAEARLSSPELQASDTIGAPTVGQNQMSDDLAQPNHDGSSSYGEEVTRTLRRILNVMFALYPAPASDEGAPWLGPKIKRRENLRHKMIVATQKANAWLSSSLRKLGTPRSNNFVRKWIGKHRDQIAAMRQIHKFLSQAQTVLANPVIRQGPAGRGNDRFGQKDVCDPHTYAYVYPGLQERVLNLKANRMEQRFVIYMCPYVLEMDDWIELSGTLIHEATHHVGTSDFEYGHSGCQDLAKREPLEALFNADSLEYLVDDLVANYAAGIGKVWLPPLKDNDGQRWSPGETVEVKNNKDEEWRSATVAGLQHGVVTARLDDMEWNEWRFFDNVKKISRDSFTMGDFVKVKAMQKDDWSYGNVTGMGANFELQEWTPVVTLTGEQHGSTYRYIERADSNSA